MAKGRILKDPKEISAALDMLLREIEEQDEAYLNKDLKVLRERVLYTHSQVEISIERLITIKVGSRADMTTFYKRLSFNEKLGITAELKIVKSSLIADMIKLNKARNDLAHPKKDNIDKYKQEEIYMHTLACCTRCIMNLGKEFSSLPKPPK